MSEQTQAKKSSPMSPEFKASVAETFASEAWWKRNVNNVKAMLPPTWTHMQNLNGLQLGYKMKLLGIDWRSQEEFGRVMIFFERIGIMQRQHMFQVRVNTDWDVNRIGELMDAL